MMCKLTLSIIQLLGDAFKLKKSFAIENREIQLAIKCTIMVSKHLHKATFRCQFHQRFYLRIFLTNVISAAFSRYVLALNKLLYEKCAHIMLMKLTADDCLLTDK